MMSLGARRAHIKEDQIMIDLSKHATSAIVTLYNDAASELGRPSVTKFQDRATAERRTATIYAECRAFRKTKASDDGVHSVSNSEQSEKETLNVETPTQTPAQPLATKKAGKTYLVLAGHDWGKITSDSYRARAIRFMVDHVGQPVKEEDLAMAVYGEHLTQSGRLGMVIVGLKNIIKRHRLPYVWEHNKERTFVLKPTAG